MRKIMLLLLLLFLCTGAYGNNSADSTQAIGVSLVLDISPPMKKHAASISGMVKQIFSNLQPGDYVELISAHHDTSRLRLAQFIKHANTPEIKKLSSIVENIKYADFLDSDVAAACDMAYKQLDELAMRQRFATGIIIILTNGNLKNREASRISNLATKCHQRNWLVYITGTHYTNRHILTAAAGKGDLRWSPLSEACPAVWLSGIRRPPPLQKEKTPVKKPPPKQPKPSLLSTKPSARQRPPVKTATITAKPAPVKADPPPKPKVQPAKPAGKPPPKPSVVKPARPARRLWPWLVLLLILAVIAIGIILAKNFKKDEIWLKELRDRLLKLRSPKCKEVLTAQYNGRTFRLGALAHLRSIHIGSNPRNSLRIQQETIAGRHLRIYRKKRQLMLRNLARTPIWLNQEPIKSGHKHPLTLPTTVRLSDTVTLQLSLVRSTGRQADLAEEM